MIASRRFHPTIQQRLESAEADSLRAWLRSGLSALMDSLQLDALLYQLAFAYEQATRHRRAPASAPALQ